MFLRHSLAPPPPPVIAGAMPDWGSSSVLAELPAPRREAKRSSLCYCSVLDRRGVFIAPPPQAQVRRPVLKIESQVLSKTFIPIYFTFSSQFFHPRHIIRSWTA